MSVAYSFMNLKNTIPILSLAMNTEKQYGWYSYLAHKQGGKYCIYKTPFNTEVKITHITNSPTEHSTNFPDIICHGEVSEFVKLVKDNSFSSMIFRKIEECDNNNC